MSDIQEHEPTGSLSDYKSAQVSSVRVANSDLDSPRPSFVESKNSQIVVDSFQNDVTGQDDDLPSKPPIRGETDGWSKVASLVRQYDESRVKDVKEDIDTLLVFAGLFSAVVTTFIVQLYQTLQEDPADTTSQVLMHISQQLGSLSLNPGFVNSTIPPIGPVQFQRPDFAVLVNILMFISLVLSLITASLGILVKQWLREYMAQDGLSPIGHIRIRHYRNQGLVKWRVFEIAALLPLLLQLALIFFLVGLCRFLVSVDLVVGYIVTSVVAFFLFTFIATTLGPTLSLQCPYKTPFLKPLFEAMHNFYFLFGHKLSILRLSILFQEDSDRDPNPSHSQHLAKRLFHLGCRVSVAASRFILYPLLFPYRLLRDYFSTPSLDIRDFRGETAIRNGHLLSDAICLRDIDATFRDDGFIDPLSQCVAVLDESKALICVLEIIAHRLDIQVPQLLSSGASTMLFDLSVSIVKLCDILADTLLRYINTRFSSYESVYGPPLSWKSETLRIALAFLLRYKVPNSPKVQSIVQKLVSLNSPYAHATYVEAAEAALASPLMSVKPVPMKAPLNHKQLFAIISGNYMVLETPDFSHQADPPGRAYRTAAVVLHAILSSHHEAIDSNMDEILQLQRVLSREMENHVNLQHDIWKLVWSEFVNLKELYPQVVDPDFERVLVSNIGSMVHLNSRENLVAM
ncbi:hypothetical protein ABKN59_001708 [Abortiporus biennis]